MKPQNQAEVVAVCSSERHGFPTCPRAFVVRPMCIVADEVYELVRQHGYKMQHGDFNEQMVVRGWGDLGDIPLGAPIVTSGGLTLRVTDYAYPCKKLESHNGKGLMDLLLVGSEEKGKKPYTKRGILCEVVTPGIAMPGDTLFFR